MASTEPWTYSPVPSRTEVDDRPRLLTPPSIIAFALSTPTLGESAIDTLLRENHSPKNRRRD